MNPNLNLAVGLTAMIVNLVIMVSSDTTAEIIVSGAWANFWCAYAVKLFE